MNQEPFSAVTRSLFSKMTDNVNGEGQSKKHQTPDPS